MEFSDILFILLAVAFSFVQWISERNKKKRKEEKEQRRGQQGPRDERQDQLSEMRREKASERRTLNRESAEEERVRKFMEALGLPTDTPIRRPSPPPAAPKPEVISEPVVPMAPKAPLAPLFPSTPEVPVQPDPFAVDRREKREPTEASTAPIGRSESTPERPLVTPPSPVTSSLPRPKQVPLPKPLERPELRPAPTSFSSSVPGLSSPLGGASLLAGSEEAPPSATHGQGRQRRVGEENTSNQRLVDFSSPQAVRRALVMGEVLGKPKGLA